MRDDPLTYPLQQSVATGAPFNPATDVELGIAYIAVFIMIMNVGLLLLDEAVERH